jgi:hypothetical protein
MDLTVIGTLSMPYNLRRSRGHWGQLRFTSWMFCSFIDQMQQTENVDKEIHLYNEFINKRNG